MLTVLTLIVQKLFLISLQRVLIHTDYLLGSEVTMELRTLEVLNTCLKGRESIITGSSDHNSRVERPHRDVCSGV